MDRHRRPSRFRKFGGVCALAALLGTSGGCDLEARVQDFIKTTLEGITTSATDAFILTPINNFISAQLDEALDGISPDSE